MRALKILVIVMGVMLVVGFAARCVAMPGGISRDGPAATAAHGFAAAPIDVPRGPRIEAMTAGPDRLIVALTLPEGGRQLVVIDLVKAVRLGTSELHPDP